MYSDSFKLLASLVGRGSIDWIKINKKTFTVKFTREPKGIQFNHGEDSVIYFLELLDLYDSIK